LTFVAVAARVDPDHSVLTLVMPSRRQFILNCSAVAVTASVTPATVLGASFRFKEVPLEQIRFSTFAARVNTVFQVQRSSGLTVGLQLAEVRPTPLFAGTRANAEDARNERFSLLFRGPLQPPLEQGSYWFEHEGIGRFAIFIVPIGSTDTGHCYYEAIFNRPIGGSLPKAGEKDIPQGRPRGNAPPTGRANPR
jgi:hypothetical protein